VPATKAAPENEAAGREERAGAIEEPEAKPEDRPAADAGTLRVETPAQAEAQVEARVDATDETPPAAPVVAPAPPANAPVQTAAVAIEAPAEVGAREASAPEARSRSEGTDGTRQTAVPAPSKPSDEKSSGEPGHRRVQVRSGDTLTTLATRAYGRANLTTLDMLRERNPEISNIDVIRAGAEIEFPDPGPSARVLNRESGLSVLAVTTPELVQALAIQETLEARYERAVDLEPTELGRRRDLYRVSIRALGGRGEALEIASRLGSILEDPGS
jgi:phage tail protein X